MLSMGIGSSHTLLETIRQLTAEGLGLEQILPYFTQNVSTLMRLEGKGKIAQGADADLLVLDEELAVRHLIVGGGWHIRDGRQQVRGSFETEPEKTVSEPNSEPQDD